MLAGKNPCMRMKVPSTSLPQHTSRASLVSVGKNHFEQTTYVRSTQQNTNSQNFWSQSGSDIQVDGAENYFFGNQTCQFKHKHSFIHSIGTCRMRRFLAVLRSLFHSSLLCTISCHSSPPTILPSSLTSSCHLFLGLPLTNKDSLNCTGGMENHCPINL